MLAVLFACGGRAGPAQEPPDYAPQHVRWSALTGTLPAQAKPATTFVATAHTGQARTAADLEGQPTALWFYPAASTPG